MKDVTSHVGRPSLALLTDLYQLTMASGYFRHGLAEREAVFPVIFRKAPFGGQYAVACGLATVLEIIEAFHFEEDDVRYLASLPGADKRPLFDEPFLDYLRGMKFSCDVDAMPEGTVVFAQEPLLRVKGPILQAQLLETALLNTLNFQTLIATKAARICGEAGDGEVIEFGLRRAQGIDGGLSASRAAFVGGCSSTSNVMAGRIHGIPVKGTHAHSWVMLFENELESFEKYAEAMPNNCVFLVDTYDTLTGVRHAVQVGRRLRERGHKMLGVRLDSGDLADLSQKARTILDEEGFEDAKIVASNDLDEYLIRDLRQQGAKIDIYGVGTRLATAYDQPALGGVYKLAAARDDHGEWNYKIKLSENAIKTSIPGIHQVRRFARDGEFVADVLYDEPTGVGSPPQIRKLYGEGRPDFDRCEAFDLLEPVYRAGERVTELPPLEESRQRAIRQLALLPESVKRLRNPAPYTVALEARLDQLREAMIEAARSENT
ncbi:MAG: nicotinate phosphoribosyltransferase [Pirellulaceae bacterium]